MSEWYILDEMNEPVQADGAAFSYWKKNNPDRWRVGRYELGNVVVSTVFLGLDHGYEDPPVLWETLVFGGPLNHAGDRYTSYEDAKKGHKHWSTRVDCCAVAD